MKHSEKQTNALLRDCDAEIVMFGRPSAQNSERMMAVIRHMQDQVKNNVVLDIVSNRYLIKYLNKGGHNRQTFIEAINADAARKGFFIYNDGTIIEIINTIEL